MSWLSSLFGGGKKDSPSDQGAQAYNSTTFDPLQAQKNQVATPLADFLKNQPGVGIGQLPTDPNYTSRYNEYLSMNPSEYFNNNIATPAHEQFNKYAVPLISEGYAGSLRGSGHYGAQEAGQVGLSEQLANTAAQFIPSFAQSQLSAGQQEFQRQYGNWFNSLPQNNPALAQAINFINAGKQDTNASSFYAPQNNLLQNMGSTGLSQVLGNIGSPTGVNPTSGQVTTSGFGDVLKNPQTWISLAQLMAA